LLVTSVEACLSYFYFFESAVASNFVVSLLVFLIFVTEDRYESSVVRGI